MSTNTQRSRKFRENLKNDADKLEAYRKRDRERKAKKYAEAKSKMSDKEKLCYREKRRMSQQKYRAKLKNKKEQVPRSEDSTGTFKSPQSLGKAVTKVKKSLPKSPTKVPHVISKVVQGLSPRKRRAVLEVCDESVKRRKVEGDDRKKRSDAMTDDEIKEVEDFFLRDDISRMCPGRKDFVSVKTPEGREHRQKRLLLVNVMEAYELFKQESQIKVGQSKFASLKPPQVLPMTMRDQDVCIEGVKKAVPTIPKTAEEILLCTVCSTDEVKCVDRECSKCGGEKPVDQIFEGSDEELSVSYYQWVTTDEGRVRKELIDGTVADAKEELTAQLQTFGRHVYNIKRQYEELKYLKQNLKHGEVIIQEDFAENFQLKNQKEIMAAHWSNEMVTVFTAVAYYRNEEGSLDYNSYAVISDETSHDKASVYAFNKAVLDSVKEVTTVEKVHYWSDGAGSQCKNRYHLTSLLYHEKDFGSEADWNFFETAHGKGPVDGVGGGVKREVWRAILQGKVVVRNAEEFYQTAQKVCQKISILYVSSEVVSTEAAKLRRRWEICKATPQTHAIHYVAKASDSTVIIAKNSQFHHRDPCKQHVLIKDPQVSDSDPLLLHEVKEKARVQKSSRQSVNIAPAFGLPEDLAAAMSKFSAFSLPPYRSPLIAAIANGQITFKGNNLIEHSDLTNLLGGSPSSEENFLSNFVIEAYLKILQRESESSVEILPWEKFEKGAVMMSPEAGRALLEQDFIFTPCCPEGGDHWCLLVVQPKQRLMAFLDSMAGDYVKPTATTAMGKMWSLLQRNGNNLSINEWRFVTNSPTEIPQQRNDFDCGVFVCLFARCLISKGVMVNQSDIPDFRKYMVLELHSNILHPIPPEPITVGKYYAVDYVRQYYIGRAIETTSSYTNFKFLHRAILAGAKRFDWPKSDDIQQKHDSCVFYGPIELQGHRPFEVSMFEEIDKVFRSTCKKHG